jgi:hypothetical protein
MDEGGEVALAVLKRGSDKGACLFEHLKAFGPVLLCVIDLSNLYHDLNSFKMAQAQRLHKVVEGRQVEQDALLVLVGPEVHLGRAFEDQAVDGVL